VAAGETLYGISRRYGIAVSTLMEDNAGLDPLHIVPGQRINVRRSEQGETGGRQIEAEMERYREALASVTGETQPETEELVLFPKDPPNEDRAAEHERHDPAADESFNDRGLDISLLLPLSGQDGVADRRFVEFYRGVLLGLEELKGQGVSASVRLWDTPRSEEAVAEIVASREFGRSDLVIGPVYDEGLAPVVEFAARRGIPVVSPLSAGEEMESGVLYRMAPAQTSKYDKIRELISRPDVNVVYVATAWPDQEMEAELRPRVTSLIDYTGATRGATFEARFDRRASENIYIVSCTDSQQVDQILGKISSMHNNLTARGITTSGLRVVGNANWAWFPSGTVDRELYFKVGVCFVANYHVDRTDPRVREFDRRYIESFGEVPPSAPGAVVGSRETRVYPYAYRGYDAVTLFGGALTSRGGDYADRVNAGRGSLQVVYDFGQTGPRSDWRNFNWSLVHYRPDYTIAVE
jgi:hypothetical protein